MHKYIHKNLLCSAPKCVLNQWLLANLGICFQLSLKSNLSSHWVPMSRLNTEVVNFCLAK